MTALKDYSERMMRVGDPAAAARASIAFEDSLDNDGITDRPVKIAGDGDHSRAIAPPSTSPAPIRRWKDR